ncbi:hypothetical protein, partial [Citrobacter portucalensis]|uniref:hypothetical protein n=1 Tax=Citrobacter portucalensis TaxID=1639133 RepID=UPI00312C9B6A
HGPPIVPVGSPVTLRWPMAADPIVYCLTRDRELASALDDRLSGAIAFFYNDGARLHQAVALRQPDVVVVDTGAVRPEYGDAGLGPVFDFLRHRAPSARLSVRPTAGVEHLVAAEAGAGVELLPAELTACVEAVAAACGCA